MRDLDLPFLSLGFWRCGFMMLTKLGPEGYWLLAAARVRSLKKLRILLLELSF